MSTTTTRTLRVPTECTLHPAAELQVVPVDSLRGHPCNPRQTLRVDVVDSIAANLNGAFPKEHAILVRPLGDVYQIISGHHRVEAAKRAGISEIPAWVRAMDDETAHMELALSNAQGELFPLEIGIHAFIHCQKEQGKKGGGRAAYAKRMGISKSYLTELCKAAEVYITVLGGRVASIYRLNAIAAHLFTERTSEADEVMAAINELRGLIDTDCTDGPLNHTELMQIVAYIRVTMAGAYSDKHKHLAAIHAAPTFDRQGRQIRAS